MVEIVECFALEDRTIFQAMLLFDRFITSYDRVSAVMFQSNLTYYAIRFFHLLPEFKTRYLIMNGDQVISTSSFQLVAGACLLIASKCNMILVTEKDICFCCDNIFSVANVISTEELVLKHLKWKLVSR